MLNKGLVSNFIDFLLDFQVQVFLLLFVEVVVLDVIENLLAEVMRVVKE